MEFKDWIALFGLFATVTGLLAGFVMWRVQLIGKRKTEVAEEALMTFRHAADALEYVRSPAIFGGEERAVAEEAGLPPPPTEPGARRDADLSFLVALWRLRQKHEQFTALRKAELLCLYHFGEKAAAAFVAIANMRQKVWAAAQTAAQLERQGGGRDPFMIEASRTVWALRSPDPIADQVEQAQRDLEAVLAPHLRSDAWLLPLAAGRDRVKAWGIAAAARTEAWAKEMIWGKPGT